MTLRLLAGDQDSSVEAGSSPDGPVLDPAAVLSATGWEVQSYGLCRGDVCRPGSFDDAPVPLSRIASTLGQHLALEAIGADVIAVLGEPLSATARAGDATPDLSLPDVDGSPVSITRRGRRTVVVTWATWCGCRYELGSWAELAAELAPAGIDLVAVALDDDVAAVRKWISRVPQLTVAMDPEHRTSDVFGVVNVPSSVWLEADGRVSKVPTVSPGSDMWTHVSGDSPQAHQGAVRAWAAGASAPQVTLEAPDESVLAARAERRLAALLHRDGFEEAAERHFAEAVRLAPLDWSIRRASMLRRGQDPFGSDQELLSAQWEQAGRPGHVATPAP